MVFYCTAQLTTPPPFSPRFLQRHKIKIIRFWKLKWKWGTFSLLKHYYYYYFIFFYPPSYGIASCVGTAGMVTWGLYLTRPCCVALGWVLILVVSPDWLRSFVNWVFSFPRRVLCLAAFQLTYTYNTRQWSRDHINIEHSHSGYSLPKWDWIHRRRVKFVIRPLLYPQATTAGFET